MRSTRHEFSLPLVFAILIGGTSACQDDAETDAVDDATTADLPDAGDVSDPQGDLGIGEDATVASDGLGVEDGVSDIWPDGPDTGVTVGDTLDDLGETRGEDATDATGPADIGEPETGEFDGFPEALDDIGPPIDTWDDDIDMTGDAVSSFDTGSIGPDALMPGPDF